MAGSREAELASREGAAVESHVPTVHVYGQKLASRDGTGKVCMGREISHVMGHTAISWLERPEREVEEATIRVTTGLKRELKPCDSD